MTRKLFLALFICAIAIITSCTKAPEPKGPLKIGINVWAGYAYAYIAQEKGYFQKNGVQVELVLCNDYFQSYQLYNEGKVDGNFEVYADAILQDAEGIGAKVVLVTEYSTSADVIVGKSEFKSLSDLKGKKIGIGAPNSFSNIFALAVLEQAGIKEHEIRFEIVPALDVPAALEKGLIDAGHTWEPAKSEALKKGYKVLAEANDVPGLITDVLVFNDKTITERPEEVKAVVKSLLEAVDFLKSNRVEAVRIMAKHEDMTEAEMRSGLNGLKILDLKENVEAMHKSAAHTSLYGSGELIADFYVKRGQLSHISDFDKIIEDRFVEELAK